jgi:uncharacterized Fe-S cluster-containing radical SAM superfamily protein
MDLLPSSVIMQPTTLCNLDCSYCYLPDRRHIRRMLPAVAQAVAASVAPWTERAVVEVCWHGGEPLTAGRAYLGQLMDHFAGLDVVHGVQTNATLVDEAWADFLAERRIHVGVSIDGPLEDNQQRADWAGRSAFDRIVRGISLLVTRGMAVSVIAVVSDPTRTGTQALHFRGRTGRDMVGRQHRGKGGQQQTAHGTVREPGHRLLGGTDRNMASKSHRPTPGSGPGPELRQACPRRRTQR